MDLHRIVIALGMVGMANTAAAAVTYDAASDFTAAGNPSGVWSFAHGTGPFGAYALLPIAIANGFAEAADDSGAPYRPAIYKAVTSDDFLTVQTTWWDRALITWTSPGDGKLDLSGSVFNIGDADVHWQVLVGSVALAVFPASPAIVEYSMLHTSQAAPQNFAVSGLDVTAGTQISIWLHPENCCGDLSGADLSISFEPVPEPSSTVMFASAVVGGAWWRGRRRARRTPREMRRPGGEGGAIAAT